MRAELKNCIRRVLQSRYSFFDNLGQGGKNLSETFALSHRRSNSSFKLFINPAVYFLTGTITQENVL